MFEAAKYLTAIGEEINGLIIIDTPCVVTHPPLPSETIETLNRLGVVKLSGKWNLARESFARNIALLSSYRPEPWDISKQVLKTLAIWAGQGIWETIKESGSKHLYKRLLFESKSLFKFEQAQGSDWIRGLTGDRRGSAHCGFRLRR